MQAMFVDWADATEEEDADATEVPFDKPYKSVRQSFEYPLRYVRLPEYARDAVDVDDDLEDEDYFADVYDSDTSCGSSEDLLWDLEEASSPSSSVGEGGALVRESELFYAKESQKEIFVLEETFKRAAEAGLDVCPEGEEPDLKLITECFLPTDEEELIPCNASGTQYDEEDDTAWESFSTTSSDDEDCISYNDSSSSSSSSLYSSLHNDEDGFPRWYSAEAYHPGFYDGCDSDEDEDVEEDEEEVRYISYEEHLRLWAEKHPVLPQIGTCSDESESAAVYAVKAP